MRRIAKHANPAAVVALLWGLVSLLAPGKAYPAQSPPQDQLPVYPGAKRVQMPEQLSANRVPIGAKVFSTEDDIDTVLGFYRKRLKKPGRKLAEKRFNPGFGYIGYYDEASGNMITVTAIEAAKGMTLIVLSAMNPIPMLGRPSLPDFMPVPPEAEDLTVTGGSGPDEYPIAVSYKLPGGRYPGCRDAVMALALQNGWKEANAIGGQGSMLLQIERGTLNATVHLQPAYGNGIGCKVSMVVISSDENEKIPQEQKCGGGISP